MTSQAESIPARGRRRKKVRPSGVEDPRPQTSIRSGVGVPGLRSGWRVIAAKEFADHVTSVRFLALTIVMALAAGAAVYATSTGLANVASQVSGEPTLFLKVFTVRRGDIPAFTTFFGFLGPLMGIAFGFDGVNGERVEATLPRLLSQPIHRDDVVNGKFVAGLAAIALIFITVTAIVAAVAIIQLGILPTAEEVLRLMIWVILGIAYVGFWLAFALLCSVVFKRAATSVLVALATWLVVTAFISLVIGIVAGLLSPVGPESGSAEQLANAKLQVTLSRLTPNELFHEAGSVVLDPLLWSTTPDLVTPVQSDRHLNQGSLLALDQSLLIIWPQFVGMIAMTAGAFALAYVSFMRQEVRA
jgi:ABC-2 type transport system permease protein